MSIKDLRKKPEKNATQTTASFDGKLDDSSYFIPSSLGLKKFSIKSRSRKHNSEKMLAFINTNTSLVDGGLFVGLPLKAGQTSLIKPLKHAALFALMDSFVMAARLLFVKGVNKGCYQVKKVKARCAGLTPSSSLIAIVIKAAIMSEAIYLNLIEEKPFLVYLGEMEFEFRSTVGLGNRFYSNLNKRSSSEKVLGRDKSHSITRCCNYLLYNLTVAKFSNSELTSEITVLRVNGNLTRSNWLMQRLADTLNLPVERSSISETCCLGAAIAAGIGAGIWKSYSDAVQLLQAPRTRFEPNPSSVSRMERRYLHWTGVCVKAIVAHSYGFSESEGVIALNNLVSLAQ
ncbi:hypothetical protein ACTXT7_015960 [Hymenolepis weldensis]